MTTKHICKDLVVALSRTIQREVTHIGWSFKSWCHIWLCKGLLSRWLWSCIIMRAWRREIGSQWESCWNHFKFHLQTSTYINFKILFSSLFYFLNSFDCQLMRVWSETRVNEFIYIACLGLTTENIFNSSVPFSTHRKHHTTPLFFPPCVPHYLYTPFPLLPPLLHRLMMLP